MKCGCVPLSGGRSLPNNACQAPAAAKIGVTLLFSGSSLLPAPLIFYIRISTCLGGAMARRPAVTSGLNRVPSESPAPNLRH